MLQKHLPGNQTLRSNILFDIGRVRQNHFSSGHRGAATVGSSRVCPERKKALLPTNITTATITTASTTTQHARRAVRHSRAAVCARSSSSSHMNAATTGYLSAKERLSSTARCTRLPGPFTIRSRCTQGLSTVYICGLNCAPWSPHSVPCCVILGSIKMLVLCLSPKI